MLLDHPVCPFWFAPVAAAHADTAAGCPTQCSLMHAARVSCDGIVENTVNTRGDRTVAPTIAYNGESTRQGSVPFARCGNTLVAAVPYSQPVPRCGVGKYYVGQKPT